MPPVKFRAVPGLTLHDIIVMDMITNLTDEEPEESVSLVSPFEDYQGYPVEFCKRELGMSFTQEVEDMLRSAQANPITLAKSANAVGKTIAAACFAVYWFLVYPDAQVYTAAAPPEENLKLLLWGEISKLVDRNPRLFEGYSVSLAGTHIKRNRYSFITGLAIPQAADPDMVKARFSGKHAPHLLFIFDEGDGVPRAVYEATEGCMSGGVARELILFNPRSEAGPVFQMEKDRKGNIVRLSAFNHPNVITGKDVIPGAVTRETTVRRINEWTVPLGKGQTVGTECFEVPAFLVGSVALSLSGEPYPPLQKGWRKILEPAFFYMVLGLYPTMAENQLISSAWVDAAISRRMSYVSNYGDRPPSGINPVAALDVADGGADKNVLTLKYGSYIAPQYVWDGVDVLVTGDRTAEVLINHNGEYVNVDGNGVGAGVPPHINRVCKRKNAAYKIMVQSSPTQECEMGQFHIMRDQMLWGLREWLRTDPGAMLPNDPLLREEIVAVKYWKDQTRGSIRTTDSTTLKELLRRSADRLFSLALLFADHDTEIAATVQSGNYLKRKNHGNNSRRNSRRPSSL